MLAAPCLIQSRTWCTQNTADPQAPRTALERRIKAAWARVLDVDDIGAEDNFFHVGAQSLLATRLIHDLRGDLNRQIDPRLVFTHSTIAEMAQALVGDPLNAAHVAPGERQVHGVGA